MQRDRTHPLARHRERFVIPEGTIYLDGNSLGALPRTVPARVAEAIEREWGQGLISSWNSADWINLSGRVGAKIAPLIGAAPRDVHVGDSTSVTLFKALVAACRLRPDRSVIVMESGTFPTDAYVAAGVAELLGLELRWCDPAEVLASVDGDTAVVSLTQVDFRTGATFDMAAITAGVHEAGALMLWDLCHSAGAVPVDLTGADADFAVGCTYKYLNGGPGSPAYVWVAPRLQATARQPITGWMGSANPFAMTRDYEPRPGVGSFASGTPPVLAMTALDAALDVFADVSVGDIRTASLSLSDYFIELVDARVGEEFEVVTPREHGRRGSQVSLRHPRAYAIVQALVARGVVGDYREPDVARFGLAPLYLSHTDVYDAIEHLTLVMQGAEHMRAEYLTKNAVT